MDLLVDRLYGAAQVREIDRRAIAAAGGDAFTLMRAAGAAAFRRLGARWPEARSLLLFCGAGNNGGDAWVVAALAARGGLAVHVRHADAEPTSDAARRAIAMARDAGVTGKVFVAHESLPAADLLVDGVLGIGLNRAPEGSAGAMIKAICAQRAPVMSLDVPSGLDADTGHAPGLCVHAQLTVCFVAAKRGLFTGVAPALTGEVVIETLGIDANLADDLSPPVHCLSTDDLRAALPPRSPIAHKGDYGHVLAIGGDQGYAGAIRLCAEAALRSGAGLVSVATRASSVVSVLASRPELMVHAVEDDTALAPLLERADVIAIGPGLGQGDWGRNLLARALGADKPVILDADALNLLAQSPFDLRADSVLTPHPGEAARLLGCTVAQIQQDRFAAAGRIAALFKAVVLLKGAGTVIAAPDGALSLCPIAEPALASGGMGDVLTGVIAALRAQGIGAYDAAGIGALVHARAARACAASHGAIGVLASEVIAALRAQLNPHSA